MSALGNDVIIRLHSLGLGNSFFQYAVARAIAYPAGGRVLFDLTECLTSQIPADWPLISEQDVDTTFAPYRMQYGFASAEDIRRYRRFRYRRGKWANRRARVVNALGLMPKTFFKEPSIHRYHSQVVSLRPPVYLEGTFINPRYFTAIAEVLEQDLACRLPLPEPLNALADTMATENSISIHIRRGDYTDPVTRDLYPLYGEDYVRRAISVIEERVGKGRYYVFSDDVDWARENILTDADAVYVSAMSSAAWMDLELMRSCRHNVICNSTFSWWGAYRNRHPEKIVVCPRVWRNDGIDINDMILSGWIAL